MAVNLRQTPRDFQNTLDVYSELVTNRRGGGFTVVPTAVVENLPAQGAARPTQFTNDISDLKPFIISIYNQKEDVDRVSLALMINPSDISIGQTYVSSDSYTREGWLTTLWGRNQSTINANCSTSGFYVHGVGLSTFFRNFSVAFKNFVGFLGIFKNGGYYYAQGQNNQDLFRNDPGRVITVMDQIKISYDDVEYLGSFSSLTVDESVEMPYRIQFNFEFIVSGMRGESAEGHLMRCDDLGCNNISGPKVSTQGAYSFEEIISLDRRALSNAFPQFMPPATNTSLSNQPDNYARIYASAFRNSNELSILGASMASTDVPPANPRKGDPWPNDPYGLTGEQIKKLGGNTKANVRSWYDLIEEKADEYGVEPWLVSAVIEKESAGVSTAVSHAGARGLMQIIPPTGRALGLTTLEEFYDPESNVDAGVRLLKELTDRYGTDRIDLVLAAYNAGPTAVKKAGNAVPPYKETQDYVNRITGELIPYYKEEWKKREAGQ